MEWEVGIYQEDFKRALQWYNLAFKDKHPSKADEEIFNKFNLLIKDMDLQDKEMKEDG